MRVAYYRNPFALQLAAHERGWYLEIDRRSVGTLVATNGKKVVAKANVSVLQRAAFSHVAGWTPGWVAL